MKREFLVGLVVSFLMFSLVTMAEAAIIAEDYTQITQTGESYSSTFIVDPNVWYTDITVSLDAKGDYGIQSTEWIDFSVDGNSLANWNYNTPGLTVVQYQDGLDYLLTGDFLVDETFFNGLLADGSLTVSWQNGPGVNPYPNEGGSDYVDWYISATPTNPTPEPATFLLFGLGLLGIAGVSRKKTA